MRAIISSVIEKLEAIKNNIGDETTYSTETKEAILNLSSITSALFVILFTILYSIWFCMATYTTIIIAHYN